MNESLITGQNYRPIDSRYIKNPLQAFKFVKNGATLYDLVVGDDCFTWVFNRAETAELNDLWCRHLLV